MPVPATTRPTPANRMDYVAGTLLTIAAVLCAGSLFVDGGARPRAFTWISGLVALGFFAAMIGLWLEPLRRRHGYVRALALAGAAILAGSGVAFTPVHPGLTLLSYWFPAVLAVLAALVLTRGHREAIEARVTDRPRASPPR